ncbi:MAG TPA: GNAT family N-acetyltransferase [Hyphomicrobiaceae bacterium]|jgi:N-acetylglutamate synthase-like GNAT family acetyltransferase|nr:GNAT family N-acetyltransferase [Hyphomicrobiaceae bacterium]
MCVYIRPALPTDHAAIVGLVRSERLNPNGLDWPNFVVATEQDRLIGAVQLRCHKDGARELGSLVVERGSRGRGLATRLVGSLLAANPGRILMITSKQHAPYYSSWCFRPIAAFDAPASVRRNYCLGQIIGGAFALLQRRPINRLVILDRTG